MKHYKPAYTKEQTGNYGFRQLDPQLGRWHVADAMAEAYYSTSPYAYVANDPVNYTDFMGLLLQGLPRDAKTGNFVSIWRSEYFEGYGWVETTNISGSGHKGDSFLGGGASGYSDSQTAIYDAMVNAANNNKDITPYLIAGAGGNVQTYFGRTAQAFFRAINNNYTLTEVNIGGRSVIFSSLNPLGEFYTYKGALLNTNESASVFLGEIEQGGGLIKNSDAYWTITGTGWVSSIASTAADIELHFTGGDYTKFAKAGSKFIKKTNVVFGVASILAEGYDVFSNENATTGDYTKLGVDVGLTVVSTVLLFVPGVNLIGIGILGLQMANSFGAFDSLYTHFN